MCKKSEVITINRNIMFNPDFIGNGWSILNEDKKSLRLTKITLPEVILETIFGKNNEEKIENLNAVGYVSLDAQVFETLWENQKLIPESWKERTGGKTTFVFFGGTILLNSSGHQSVLCLYWRSERWQWGCYHTMNSFVKDSPSALLKVA